MIFLSIQLKISRGVVSTHPKHHPLGCDTTDDDNIYYTLTSGKLAGAFK